MGEKVDGQREDNGGIFLCTYGIQSLHVAELKNAKDGDYRGWAGHGWFIGIVYIERNMYVNAYIIMEDYHFLKKNYDCL